MIYDNKTFTKIYYLDAKNIGSSSYNFEYVSLQVSDSGKMFVINENTFNTKTNSVWIFDKDCSNPRYYFRFVIYISMIMIIIVIA